MANLIHYLVFCPSALFKERYEGVKIILMRRLEIRKNIWPLGYYSSRSLIPRAQTAAMLLTLPFIDPHTQGDILLIYLPPQKIEYITDSVANGRIALNQ